MGHVELQCGFIEAQSHWPPHLSMGVSVDEDGLLFQVAVQQKDAVVHRVCDQHTAVGVE